MLRRGTVLASLAAILMALPAPAADEPEAAHRRFELGLRYTLMMAGGEPANDMPYIGVVFRYAMNERWGIGAAVDKVEFDFEAPAGYLGLQQDSSVPTEDSKIKGQQFSVWVDRQYGKAPSHLRWFWSGGLGFTSPSASDARGPLEGGGTFDIQTDVGTELIPTFAGGARWILGERWVFELAGRLDYHVADWTLRDQVSGNTATVGGYLAYGAHLAVAVRF
jgi:hypothetical protein